MDGKSFDGLLNDNICGVSDTAPCYIALQPQVKQ